MSDIDNGEEVLHSEAIYGAMTKQALVRITIGNEIRVVDAADARKFALDLLDVAHASDGDKFMFEWMMEKLDIDLKTAAAILQDFRKARAIQQLEREANDER